MQDQRIAAFALLLCGLASGCSQPDRINDVYGKRRSIDGADSVNGVGVLAEMFAQAGFRVSTWKRLSPKLEQADVIVWAPDDFQPPRERARQWLENWLADKKGRRLVYIGRDYDAEPAYWRDVLPRTPPQQYLEAARRLGLAQSEHDAARIEIPKDKYCRWFTVRRGGPRRKIAALEGPWSAAVDAAKANITLGAELDAARPKDKPNADAKDPPAYHETLLASGEVVLAQAVGEPAWRDSEVLAIANGSFLLNYPLVNRQHRILAGRLIERCSGAPGDQVVFLETGPYGPRIRDQESASNSPTGLEMFTVWPINAILLHLTALGILLLACLYPIFGRPRRLPPPETSDFGRHVEALGELLEETREIGYASSRLAHYHQYVKRDSGKSHLAGARPVRRGGDRSELHIRLTLQGRSGPNERELAMRAMLEQRLAQRQVGEIVGLAAGRGEMDIALLVSNPQEARTMIEAILRELGLEDKARLVDPSAATPEPAGR